MAAVGPGSIMSPYSQPFACFQQHAHSETAASDVAITTRPRLPVDSLSAALAAFEPHYALLVFKEQGLGSIICPVLGSTAHKLKACVGVVVRNVDQTTCFIFTTPDSVDSAHA